MLNFVVLDNGDGSPLREESSRGSYFKVFNNRIDAWNHLIQMGSGPDARVAEVEFKIIIQSGENE